MQVSFNKYQGTGNDFVILDNRNGQYRFTQEQVAALCDRRFGIGADGLMLLNNRPGYHFEMVYYNADGRVSSMCGNGGRCLVKFAFDLGIDQTIYRFLAVDGEHEARIEDNGDVALKMADVGEIKEKGGRSVLNTGSPHCIVPAQNVMHLDVVTKGRAIRNSDEFRAEGINVNFVEQTDEADHIIVRTYERGVEDETYSCGTGVTAAALVNYHNEAGFNLVTVKTKGGVLRVEYDKHSNGYTNVWLIGPATKVFGGTIDL